MRLRGDLIGAEQQAVEACEDSTTSSARSPPAVTTIGEIRRRLGDFAAADEAYRAANQLGLDPQPGLACFASPREDRRRDRGHHPALDDVKESAVAPPPPAGAGRDLDCGSRSEDGSLGGARAREIVDAYKIGRRRAPAFDATVHVAFWPDQGRRGRRRGSNPLPATGPRRMAAGRCAVRDGACTDAARNRLPAPGRRARGQRLSSKPRLRRSSGWGRSSMTSASKSSSADLVARRTFLFTDIVDSTRLLETLGDEKWKKLLARHDQLVRDRIVESGGEVIKQTGDGFFASFDNPKGAIQAAVAIQRTLDAEIVAPDVRIGVHTGEAFQQRRCQRLRRAGRTHTRQNRRSGGAGGDPGQPRDARRNRERVPALRAAGAVSEGVRAGDRRRVRRLALVATA